MQQFSDAQIRLLALAYPAGKLEDRVYTTRERLAFLGQLTVSQAFEGEFQARCRFLELLLHGLAEQQELFADMIQCYAQEGDSANFKQKLEEIAQQLEIV